jgi:ArsR family transcriptional regulator
MPTRTPISTERIAGICHALSDEKRLRILELLAGGERCVCDLTGPIEVGQSLLSFHMKTLKNAGLVTDRREGRWVHYTLDAEALAEAEEWLGELRSRAERTGGAGGCCG